MDHYSVDESPSERTRTLRLSMTALVVAILMVVSAEFVDGRASQIMLTCVGISVAFTALVTILIYARD